MLLGGWRVSWNQYSAKPYFRGVIVYCTIEIFRPSWIKFGTGTVRLVLSFAKIGLVNATPHLRWSNPGGGKISRTHPDRPWGPPGLLYNGYHVFPGGNAAGAWCWPPTLSKAKVKDRVELYLYSPSGPSWPILQRTLQWHEVTRLSSSLCSMYVCVTIEGTSAIFMQWRAWRHTPIAWLTVFAVFSVRYALEGRWRYILVTPGCVVCELPQWGWRNSWASCIR